ncbi:MAG TPA: NAD(P)-dependent oxidoreductase [Rhizomicrobium sp.]|nr:NAD(P)-dependent oxidoreductase [Rhizomicrobium sp.]
MNIVLHYRASPGFREQLAAVLPKGWALSIIDETDDAAFAAAMKTADVLLHVLRPVRAADIEAAPHLKLIQKIGVGVNTIDLDAARKAGVAVCNMPGTNTQAVAELALMLMLATLRRVTYFDPLMRRGAGWRPDTVAFDRSGEIAGRTVGFVGYGAVPQRLSPVLEALGATLIYNARSPKEGVAARFVGLDELFATADIVSLHCPATPETIGMISRDALSRMKKGAVLINTARGELVDEAALVDALNSGALRGAGLDVFCNEPVEEHPLFGLANVVVTPHIAWLTPETLARSVTVAFENCRRISAGETVLHKVA